MADNLTPKQRSYAMSRVRNKDTDLERKVRSRLHGLGFRFRKNVRSIQGSPDIVFPKQKVVVFVDGDFWHGYRFPAWRETVSKFWQKKIEINRKRDQRTFASLRRMGWRPIRVWQHEIEKNLDAVIERIVDEIDS